MKLITILACLLPMSSSAAQETAYRPAVGQPHPHFVLPNIENGKAVSLDSFRGRKFLLFHFASW